MKLLGMDICLCRTVLLITASQKGFPLGFYNGFAAYIHTREQDRKYKGTGMYNAFQKSFDSRHTSQQYQQKRISLLISKLSSKTLMKLARQ